jgi:flotillin
MSQIQKDASIAKAQADRDVAIAVAEAKQKANEASVQSDIIIAERNNDLAIKQANLKVQADTKKAEADAAYEIQKQEQQKVIGVKATDAEIAKTQQEAILRQKMVDVRQQELEAEINRKADADKYQKQKLAEAELIEKQKQAEAALYNQQKKSEAERVIAETEKYKAIQDTEAKKAQAEAQRYAAEQEAAGIKAKYDAEAAGIQAKGLAEAEAMEKKAEAMKKYGQAAILEMIVKVLPDVAKAVAEPLASIDKVTVFAGGDGSNGGVSGISANVPTVMAQTFETVKAATGVDLADIVKASGYDAKVTRNINVSGLDGEGKVADGVVAGAIADAVKTEPDEGDNND